MKGSCIFFHDFRMVQLSLANELPPVRAKLACTASAHFCKIWFAVFLEAKYGTCFALGKTEIIFVKMARGSMNEIVTNFICFNISAFICLFVYCWIYFTIEQGAILAQALLDGFCPPALTCLLLCSVLSTGMFAVLIADIPFQVDYLVLCLVGWEEGRTECIHVCGCEWTS